MPTEPRGIRNNNPGNIRHGDKWDGLASIQGDESFCTFKTMQHGIRAMAKTLITYRDVHHLKNPGQVIKRWAPESDGNDTYSYVRHVEDLVQRKNWGMQGTEALAEYVRAICVHENGQRWAAKWMPYVVDGVGMAV